MHKLTVENMVIIRTKAIYLYLNISRLDSLMSTNVIYHTYHTKQHINCTILFSTFD
jgi:ABC-type dipeptide/oligopeptide/nickel transport system ATPase subunit